MKQLITRLDDDLHRRLKQRASAEGRSVNALVTELLETVLGDTDPRTRLRARLKTEGRLVSPPAFQRRGSRDQVIRSLRGTGSAVSRALEKERSSR